MPIKVSNNKQGDWIWEDRGAKLVYLHKWLLEGAADELFLELKCYPHWKQGDVFLFGKGHKTPRLESWVGDNHVKYRYSGQDLYASPWPSALKNIADRLSRQLNATFNSCLMNWYRDGRDKMGWHADDEKELGDDPVIASLSLGQERFFDLKPKDKLRSDRQRLLLGHGSLLVMSGSLQRTWLHQVPVQKRVLGSRMNFTFRGVGCFG